MNGQKILKKTLILITPILLFAALIVPYSLLNQHLIVNWLGCGCPVIDINGNMVESKFNANDFTALFWLFVSICTTVLSAFLSKRIFKSKVLAHILYVSAIFLVLIFFSYRLYQLMMWN